MKIIILFLFIFICNHLKAQTEIHGKVCLNKVPQNKVRVEIKGKSDIEPFVTGSDGKFFFKIKKEKSYIIEVFPNKPDVAPFCIEERDQRYIRNPNDFVIESEAIKEDTLFIVNIKECSIVDAVPKNYEQIPIFSNRNWSYAIQLSSNKLPWTQKRIEHIEKHAGIKIHQLISGEMYKYYISGFISYEDAEIEIMRLHERGVTKSDRLPILKGSYSNTFYRVQLLASKQPLSEFELNKLNLKINKIGYSISLVKENEIEYRYKYCIDYKFIGLSQAREIQEVLKNMGISSFVVEYEYRENRKYRNYLIK